MGKECLVKMEDITVEFPGVLALDKVQFEARRGEVHVLLGENGAGKSTIMKVLAGVNTHYKGKIIYKGEEIRATSVLEQRQRGVSIIFQEMNLLRNLTVAENIFLGRQPLKGGNIDWEKMNKDARALLDSIQSNVSEKALISRLSVGQMQMVEIAKALSFESDIIIMDEPTSALTDKEVDALFSIISKLKAQNVAVVYISHRLDEILKIGDVFTVFRDGKYIKTVPREEATVDSLINLMVGRDLSEQYPKVKAEIGEKRLEVKDLSGTLLKNISFHACAGEIVGFYGLMGAGRTELMRAIFGADKYTTGEILVDGKRVKIKSCEDAKKNGIALLTEDRKNQGLILKFSVKDNMVLANLNSICTNYGLSLRKESQVCSDLSKSLTVKTPSLSQKVKLLSGGNQQKVVIAKWLNTDSKIIIFDEPTRGIDVGAKVEIYKIMNALKQAGKAVLMVSSELPETLGVSDRMYVMQEGRITKCFDNVSGIAENDVIKYAVGSMDEEEKNA